MAMVMVIAVSALLAVLLVAGTAFALSSQRQGRHTQDWDAALAAAYAGVEEYRSRVTNDSSYWRYGNPAAAFTIDNGSAATVTLPPTTNAAFGLGTSGTWTDVSGSDGAARFRYEVDTSTYMSTGLIRLRSTGAVGDETRSVVASITQEGFIKYLYWTDYEVLSPSAACITSNWNATYNRLKYGYEGRSTTQCGTIQFAAGDVIRGPLYTNDRLTICGATFQDTVQTMDTITANGYVRPNGCGAPNFAVAGSPSTPAAQISMPPTNSDMKKETRTDLPDEVPTPGCLYTGPTTITFNSNGSMTVRSPWTVATQTSGSGDTGGSTPSQCGVPGSGAGQLGSAAGATVPVTEGNVIYIQNVPAAATNVNYTAQTNAALLSHCGVTNNTANGLGYPATNESAPPGTYGCTVGDAFIKGQVNGHVTVAAENNVWVVGNTTYVDQADDMLGLVGQNSVTVWHPVRADGSNLLPNANRTIHAAVLSVTGTFVVQNYASGVPIGTLTVLGAIAQKYRGPVGTGNNVGPASGYLKNYNYDTRFQTVSPPKFLKTTIVTYMASQFAEVDAAFDADGNAT